MTRRLLTIIVAMALICACEGIDCTLNNVVTLNIGFYSSESGKKVSISDTLNITAEGTDSVLLNRGYNISSVALPMSYWQAADTLHMLFHASGDTDETFEIVLRIAKDNTQYFESPDCPTVMMHKITGFDYDDPYQLTDSIVVENTSINYASLENIKIYLRGSTN